MVDIGLEIFELDDKQRRLEQDLCLVADQGTRNLILAEIKQLKARKDALAELL